MRAAPTIGTRFAASQCKHARFSSRTSPAGHQLLPCLTRTSAAAPLAQETKETTWQKPGTAPAKDSAGNVYDDESEQDDGPDFSSAMKQKMINEAGGLGADPNKKNPFLLVFFGIGVFVVAGALSSGML